jgi:hypothetical protein
LSFEARKGDIVFAPGIKDTDGFVVNLDLQTEKVVVSLLCNTRHDAWLRGPQLSFALPRQSQAAWVGGSTWPVFQDAHKAEPFCETARSMLGIPAALGLVCGMPSLAFTIWHHLASYVDVHQTEVGGWRFLRPES